MQWITSFELKKLPKNAYYFFCKNHSSLQTKISQVVKTLSEIIISYASAEFETPQLHPHNDNSVKLEKLNKQNYELDVHSNYLLMSEIKDLFEIFIDLYKKQDQSMHPIMIKIILVKILNEMIRRPSYYWLASLIYFFTFMYLIGCVKKDMKKAFHMYSKVSDGGFIIALHNVVYCYEGGFGIKKNEGKAFELYLKLAKEGYPVAQYDVSRCYSTGKGISKDEAKGFQWYIKSVGSTLEMYFCPVWCAIVLLRLWYRIEAAKNGCIDSQYTVGKCFCEGCGTEKDIVKAMRW
ncbi:hypothetical protein Glove_37g85 [Diversispora epigaea]|uniref:HCP-like protein n=1 Tax=Diversispora epigaea TaxID=1348612 RepID=A0A397JQW6_9GLOM|nr:hypothetical protein Glove_37g85 [Diversispora epigaea]